MESCCMAVESQSVCSSLLSCRAIGKQREQAHLQLWLLVWVTGRQVEGQRHWAPVKGTALGADAAVPSCTASLISIMHIGVHEVVMQQRIWRELKCTLSCSRAISVY